MMTSIHQFLAADCMIVFADVGSLHGFLDILSRSTFKKFVFNSRDTTLLGFNLTASEAQLVSQLAAACKAKINLWEAGDD